VKRSVDGTYKISLISVDGLAELHDLVPELGDGAVVEFERLLQLTSDDVEIVGQLGAGRYALVHRRAFDTERLLRQVESFVQELDPDGDHLTPRSTTFDLDRTGWREDDAARAPIYAEHELASREDTGFNLASTPHYEA